MVLGGLRTRLGHHLWAASRPHWHIDYLRAHANPEEVWYCHHPRPWEHTWAQCIGMQPGASIPMAGFEASDCACESHLYFFKGRPSQTAFSRSLRALERRHPPWCSIRSGCARIWATTYFADPAMFIERSWLFHLLRRLNHWQDSIHGLYRNLSALANAVRRSTFPILV